MNPRKLQPQTILFITQRVQIHWHKLTVQEKELLNLALILAELPHSCSPLASIKISWENWKSLKCPLRAIPTRCKSCTKLCLVSEQSYVLLTPEYQSVRHWWGSTESQWAGNTRHRDLEEIQLFEYCFQCTWQQDVQILSQTQEPASHWSPTPSSVLASGKLESLNKLHHF